MTTGLDADELDNPQGDDLDELMQEEPEPLIPAIIPVTVTGNVRTRALPARSWVSRKWTLQPGESVQVVGYDPRRARVRIWSGLGGEVYVGANQAEVEALTCASLDTLSEVLVMEHQMEVWCGNADAVTPAIVNVIVEQWAD